MAQKDEISPSDPLGVDKGLERIGDAAATSKPIIFLDIGVRNLSRAAEQAVADRCIVVKADPENAGDLREQVMALSRKQCVNSFSTRFSLATKPPRTKPGDVFYDVGANIGLYSIFVAKRLNGETQVYSFEPESQNYASLNRNVYLNGLSECVTTLCLAVSDISCVNRGSTFAATCARERPYTNSAASPMTRASRSPPFTSKA